MIIIIDMSTYILMKLFESIPSAYDRGIGIITLGAVNKAYDRLCSSINLNDRVLDIGCGTGALLLWAALKGARVTGIDIHPGMLAIAKKRVKESGLEERTLLKEMGVAELDTEEAGSYDVVMSSLCFSELTEEERSFTIRQVWRILKPGGLFLLADEVHPHHPVIRFLFFFLRALLVVITWIITRTTTRPVKNLKDTIEKGHFTIISEKRSAFGSFIEIKAQKGEP